MIPPKLTTYTPKQLYKLIARYNTAILLAETINEETVRAGIPAAKPHPILYEIKEQAKNALILLQ